MSPNVPAAKIVFVAACCQPYACGFATGDSETSNMKNKRYDRGPVKGETTARSFHTAIRGVRSDAASGPIQLHAATPAHSHGHACWRICFSELRHRTLDHRLLQSLYLKAFAFASFTVHFFLYVMATAWIISGG